MIAKQLFRVAALVALIAAAACADTVAPCTPNAENVGKLDCPAPEAGDLEQ